VAVGTTAAVVSNAIPDWLGRIYPFAPKMVVTPRGARMSYLDEGPRSEEAVLMLHGNPTWSFYFRELVRTLSPRVRCVVPDHVGMGLSEKPQNYDYTLATRIADIEALIESLRLKRVRLVVHDWGGAIGFGVAVRRPELIERLVVLNTAAFPAPWIPARIAICKAPVIGTPLVRGLNGFAGPATWMAMHRRALSADEKRGYLFPYGSWADRVAVNAFVRDIPLRASHRSWSVLQAVEAGLEKFRDRRALIVWGGRDFCFNDRFLGRWREMLPAAEVRRIADAGHYVLEDAREDAVPLLAEFLR
ncbi:MAG TPA: alpha/beta fold hydrolase, partial [Opitutus sp.]|nr:alpha/beta fold hydrolase [Opitutus sp.]